MKRKNGLIRMKVFLQCSLWFLFISLAVFLSSDGFPQAAEEAAHPLPATTAQAASVLATANGEQPGTRVEIQELKRTRGGTLMLKFTMINDSNKKLGFGSAFGESEARDFDTMGGVHLIDPVSKKKYFVFRDMEGNCVCSRGLSSGIQPGSRTNLWAKFPAPPKSVQKITVVIPHFSPMDDVPISQ